MTDVHTLDLVLLFCSLKPLSVVTCLSSLSPSVTSKWKAKGFLKFIGTTYMSRKRIPPTDRTMSDLIGTDGCQVFSPAVYNTCLIIICQHSQWTNWNTDICDHVHLVQSQNDTAENNGRNFTASQYNQHVQDTLYWSDYGGCWLYIIMHTAEVKWARAHVGYISC